LVETATSTLSDKNIVSSITQIEMLIVTIHLK
jgi:hypothetical protein